MTHLGHEDQFPRPSLSGRCRLGEATFAAMGRKEEDAPKAPIRAAATEPPGSLIADLAGLDGAKAPARAPYAICR
jgi:hypothetical protein